MTASSPRASYVDRLARRANDAPFALCAGIDPSPDALALLEGIAAGGTGRTGRTTRAAAMERFGGLLVEAVRDVAVAVKPQVAWFEHAGAPGMRALERVVSYARAAGLLVVIDAKRGDVPHSAAAYADAWLGEDAASGIAGDALTVHGAVGRDSVEAMARVAAERSCALYALLFTSNAGAAELQSAARADGHPWWYTLAAALAAVDTEVGPGVVGAVVGATRPAVVHEAQALLPQSPLLLPGVGAQGGSVDELGGAARTPNAPTALVNASRSLLPAAVSGTAAFRFQISAAAAELSRELAGIGTEAPGAVG